MGDMDIEWLQHARGGFRYAFIYGVVIVAVGVVAAKCVAKSNCCSFREKHCQSFGFLRVGCLSSTLSF